MWECKWNESLNPYKSDKVEKASPDYIEFKDEYRPYCVVFLEYGSGMKTLIGYIKSFGCVHIRVENCTQIKYMSTDIFRLGKEIAQSGISKETGVMLMEQDGLFEINAFSNNGLSYKIFECTEAAKENIRKFLDGE